MQPIVHGLQAEFAGRVTFEFLNARDGAAGQAAFTALGLAGHPALLVFDAAGRETYRAMSVQPAQSLRAALELALTPPSNWRAPRP